MSSLIQRIIMGICVNPRGIFMYMPRRKKKRRYKTGLHKSKKCKTEIRYRSGWEYNFCLWADKNDEIIEYEYENVVIPYVSNLKTGRVRKYYVDFLVYYCDGSKKLIEIKREDKLNDIKVMKKCKAAEEWCRLQENIGWEIWTEKKLKELKILLPPQKKKKKPIKRKIKK